VPFGGEWDPVRRGWVPGLIRMLPAGWGCRVGPVPASTQSMRRDELLRRRGATGPALDARRRNTHQMYLTNCIYVFIQYVMPKEMTAFRIEPEIMDGLRRVKDRDGVPFSVQVDRALRAWLKKRGVSVTKAPASNHPRPRSVRRSK
jgi:hypothetical protein